LQPEDIQINLSFNLALDAIFSSVLMNSVSILFCMISILDRGQKPI